ncbi:MAG TPA: glycerophosphodiester phosphodiesterase family protein, partial [Bacillota bacterium]|nr:glycerophosphodiester phosphodiesterase family protein [Bacillota bacterium]
VNGRRPIVLARRLSAKWLAELQKTGARIVVWSRRIAKQAVHLAHDRGLQVWVYTVNDARLANRLLDMEVDGIITNNPALIWKTLALRTKGWKPAKPVGRAEAPSHP